MESRACAYTTAQTATAAQRQQTTFDALQGGKNERKRANRINTRPQAQTRLKTAYTASAVQFTPTATPTPTKTGIMLHNNTAVGKTHKNAKMSIKTSEKKLAMQFRRVYYKLASNEGGSLRTGRSPHNRQRGQLSLKFLTIKKSSRRDKK